MTIYTITCAQNCPPMHYTTLYWAEAGMKAHFIARGHDCAMTPTRVEATK